MSRVINRVFPVILLTVIALAFSACGNRTGSSASGTGGPNDVAAKVNNKDIKLSEIDTILNQQAKGQKDQLSPLELAAARLTILDELIKQEVLYQRAEKEGLLPKDDEITQAINEQKVQNGMTEEQYQQMLKESNQTEADLRNVARKQIAVNKLLDRIGSKVGTPSEKEVQDFYSNNKQRYVAARGVGLSVIVVDPANNDLKDDAKSESEAKQKIDIIYQRVKIAPESFAAVARERSEDPTGPSGGDLGFLTEDQLAQAGLPQDLIGKLLGPMQVGDVTPPQRKSTGQWYIFKLTDRRQQTENLTLDNPNVRKDITDALVNQRKQILIEAMLRVAMSEAKIENRLAANIVASPDKMSGLRPASAATPAPTASPAASASPQASATPAATATTKKQ